MKIDYKKYKKIEELFTNNSKKDLIYNCPVCAKEMKIIHLNHLKTHNLTKEEFTEKYGLPNEFYLKRHILDLIIDKIYSLYITNTDKWLSLSAASLQYSTKVKGGDCFRVFNRGDIKSHLNGGNVIGVFPLEECSKFLIFDIDAYYSRSDAEVITSNIKHVLQGYFPKDQIHVTYSGSKGYHVELFFDKLVAIKDLQELFDIVLCEIDIKNYEGVNVEIRPEKKGKNGKGIKLPLGMNHKNNKDNNYCYFADENLEEVENEIEYILNIQKSNISIVDEIISEYKNKDVKSYENGYMNNSHKVEVDNSIFKINDNKDDKDIPTNKTINDYGIIGIENYFKNGLIEIGTRHNISLLIAMYLKGQGHSIEENEEILIKWSLKQVEREMSKSNSNEIMRDVKGILKSVYDKNKNYRLSKFRKDVYINKEDLNKLEALNTLGKKKGSKVISHQKILYAMLIHRKRYSDGNGKFYMTYDQIIATADIKSRNSICKCIGELEEWGYLDIVSRGVKEKDINKKLPNIYCIKFSKDEENDGIHKICNNKNLCKNCYYNMINKCYSKDTIYKIVTRRVKCNVLKIRDVSICSINY